MNTDKEEEDKGSERRQRRVELKEKGGRRRYRIIDYQACVAKNLRSVSRREKKTVGIPFTNSID